MLALKTLVATVAALPPTTRGAPGPIVAAGLPFLVVAAGAHWMVRRRRSRALD